MSDPSTERRRFHRIATDKRVLLRAETAEHGGTVLDVSLRGLLFEVNDGWHPEQGTRIHAQLQLEGADCCIEMDGEVAHIDGRRVGLRCIAIDLDSASRLRRMVELNLADPELLERDLEQLVAG